VKTSGLSCEDTENKNEWSLRIKKANSLVTQVYMENGAAKMVCVM